MNWEEYDEELEIWEMSTDELNSWLDDMIYEIEKSEGFYEQTFKPC